MPQIEKPDDLQLFANHPFFCVCMTIACYDGNKKKVGLCQMVLMTSKTSLQKWSGVFLFPSVSPVFFQIGTVTYQHRLRFRWRGFMYEFLPLIRKARTRCDLTGFHLAARSAQVLLLGRLACLRSSRPGARGLSARFHTLSLPHAPRLCPVAVDITMLTRRKLRLEEVYSERLSQKHFQRQLLISAMRFLKLSRFLNPKQLRFRLLILRFIPSTGPLEKSYSTLLRTAVMFFFKVEIVVSML